MQTTTQFKEYSEKHLNDLLNTVIRSGGKRPRIFESELFRDFFNWNDISGLPKNLQIEFQTRYAEIVFRFSKSQFSTFDLKNEEVQLTEEIIKARVGN